MKGDILMCKKSLFVDDLPIFICNKEYLISYEGDSILYIKNDNSVVTYGAYFKRNKYSFDDNYYLWDYFYTDKELRKLKLKKINNEVI